ncbi:MAG TPA: proline--tRNA ligase, partial [Firmicutes bacterium]|nr:proline--tRNA ligase [Bacillota bacterium]
WVTHGGSEKLEERLCVRPTSETLFCEHYANIVHSWRDLPKLYNQWVSVVRWEKTTRPFLRSREFLWQEGHTIHATAEEAIEETERMLDVYAEFCEKSLAMPVVKGRKTDSDKFAGAVATYAIEAMMHDGKALQAGTSHYFGDGFARAFGIQFTGKDNTLQTPHQTSWGVSTRLIGAVIMAHGDDNGLVLPPAVAPIQVVILPIAQHKPGVLEKAAELKGRLSAVARVKVDDSENSAGWKFAEYEMKGVPLRLEIGPKDIENNQCVLVCRHNREKHVVPLDELETAVPALLQQVHDGLYQKALDNRRRRTWACTSLDEITRVLEEKGDGFIEAMWCGDEACEDAVKEKTGVGSRCIPFEQKHLADTCVCCGRPARQMVVWAKAY